MLKHEINSNLQRLAKALMKPKVLELQRILETLVRTPHRDLDSDTREMVRLATNALELLYRLQLRAGT